MASKDQLDRKSFVSLLADVKLRIQTAQTRAMLAVNSELVRLYWDIGRMIDARQKFEGWGSGVIPRLAAELKNEMPELKGFSERNIGLMIAFHKEYPDPAVILQQPVAKLSGGAISPQAVAKSTETGIVQRTVAQFDNTPYLDEAQVEVVTVEYFRGLGYEYVHGPSIAPDGDVPERTSYGHVVLLRRLQVTRTDSPDLIVNNRAFHRLRRVAA